MTILAAGPNIAGQKGAYTAGAAPRFLQIADWIRAQIAEGSLGEHDPLPSERVIAENENVSRMTARRALDALESEGLVYSADRRGRFVSPPRMNYDVSHMISFVANARRSRSDMDISLVYGQLTPADATVAQQLGLTAGSNVYESCRLFKTTGQAVVMETECVSADRFPDFLDHDLCQSTTEILDRSYGATAQYGDVVIRMRGVSANEAPLLGLNASQSGIELEQIIRDADERPFCFGRQFWRGELAEFTARAMVEPGKP